MLKRSLAMLLASSLFAAPVFAYYSDYLPASLISKTKSFPQRLVKYGFESDWTCEVLKGVTATNKEGEFSVTGTDRNGNAWTIKDPEQRYFGGSCYIADLDKNGQDDLVFWFATGSNGFPFSVVSVYFFDENGTPHYQEVVSRFGNQKAGVPDILEAPDGKGAYILVQDLSSGNVDEGHTYWRFSMMRARNCALEEVSSAMGTHFPCWVWFTNKPNHLLSKHGATLEVDYQETLKKNLQEEAKFKAEEAKNEETKAEVK